MNPEVTLDGFELSPVVEIDTLNSAFICNFNKDYKGHPESHYPLEFIYVDKGSQVVYEGNQSFTINQGEAFLHKSLVTHWDRADGQPTTAYIFAFTCKSDAISCLYDQVLKLDESNIYELKDAFNCIRKEGYQDKSDFFRFTYSTTNKNDTKIYAAPQKIRIKLETLFIGLLEKFYHVEETKVTVSKSTQLLQEEICKSLYSKFNLGDIARKLYYSKSYLCRKFKEDTGITIVQYLYDKKIGEAKTLLLNTNNSLKDISDMLCFESVQYFTYVFKKYAGLSPNQWKKIVSKPRFY